MGDRFAERMQDPEVIADTRLLGDFAVIYCRGVHEAVREPLESEAAGCTATPSTGTGT
jgi:hypothetical protein